MIQYCMKIKIRDHIYHKIIVYEEILEMNDDEN